MPINIKSISKVLVKAAGKADIKAPIQNLKGMMINEGLGGAGGIGGLGQLMSLAQMAQSMFAGGGGGSGGSSNSTKMQNSATEIDDAIDDAIAASSLSTIKSALTPTNTYFADLDEAIHDIVGGYGTIAEQAASIMWLKDCSLFSACSEELEELAQISGQVGWVEFSNIGADIQVLFGAVQAANMLATIGENNIVSGGDQTTAINAIHDLLNSEDVDDARANVVTRIGNLLTLMSSLNTKISNTLVVFNDFT